MIELLAYIVKSILTGALLFGFYHFAMRRESLFVINRVYLISVSLLMLLLPLIGSTGFLSNFFSDHQPEMNGFLLPEITINAERMITVEQEQNIMSVARIGYLLITLSMLTGLIAGIIRIIRFYSKAQQAQHFSENIFLISEDLGPFSFLGKIFINRNYLSHPELQSIIVHERTHIQQYHLIDLLWLEVLSRTFWFNPFFYLIKQALRETHEFLADRAVLNKGIKPLEYQMLLFNEISGNSQYILANNFNLLTKKRIIMLTKISSKFASVRIALMLPAVVLIAILVSALPINSVNAQKQTPEKQNVSKTANQETQKKPAEVTEEDIFQVVEKMPEYPGGEQARALYMVNSIKYPDAARKSGLQGTVYVTFVIEKDGEVTNVKVLRGIGGGCDEEAVRVVKNMPKWKPGEQKGEPVRVQFNVPIKFALSDKK